MTSRVGSKTALLALALVACGDSTGGDAETGTGTGTEGASTTGTDGTSTGPGADSTTGESSSGGSTTDTEGTTGDPLATLPVEVLLPGGDPAEGALVALDYPGGERVELTTDATGRVEFEEIDWSLGDAPAVTAYLPDHRLTTLVELSPDYVASLPMWLRTDDGGVSMPLELITDTTSYVTLSGTVQNMADPANYLLVVPSTGGTYNQGSGPDWTVQAPADEPLTLLATEFVVIPGGVSPVGVEQMFVAWSATEQPGVSENTAVSIDLADTLVPQTTSGSFPVPADTIGTFFSEARPYIRVASATHSWPFFFGFPTLIDIGGGGAQVDYDLEWVTVAGIDDPMWELYMYTESSESVVWQVGYPTAGAQSIVLPEPPGPIGAPLPDLAGPIDWVLGDVDAADPELYVNLIAYTELPEEVWFVLAPPGTTETTLPALPSTADAGTYVESITRLRVRLCEDNEPDVWGCERYASSLAYSAG